MILTLTAQMLPSLEKAAGKDNVHLINAITGAEDFSYFQKEVPGLYFFLSEESLLMLKKKMRLLTIHLISLLMKVV